MEFIKTTLSERPELVNEYLAMLSKVNGQEKDAKTFTPPAAKSGDHFMIAVENGKVVGGVKIEITTPEKPHVLAFQRKEVFNTVKRNLGYLDIDKMQLADLSHITVDGEHRSSGLGMKLFEEAFKYSASLGSDITFIWPNHGVNSDDFFSRIEKATAYPTFQIGTVDLITDNFDRVRNTKRLVAVAHSPVVAQQLRAHDKGIIPVRGKPGATAFFASPYGKAAGVEAVLFDWDNVLSDDATPWVGAISATLRDLKREGHKIPSNLRSTRSQHPKDYLTTVLGADLAEKAYPLLMKHYEELMPQTVSLKPEAVETLRLLKKNNVPFAIVSNLREPNMSLQFKHLLHPEFADVPVFGGAGKPDTKVVVEALQALKVKNPEKVFFVGDSGDNDVRASLAAGIKPILFSAGDLDIIEKLSDEKQSAFVGFVRNHSDLQKLLSAQIAAGKSQVARGA